MADFRACGSSARCEILSCLKIVPSTTCVQKYAHTYDVLLNRMTCWSLQTAVITDFTQHSLRSCNDQDVGHTHSTFVSSTDFEKTAVSAGVLCLSRHLPLFSPSIWPSDKTPARMAELEGLEFGKSDFVLLDEVTMEQFMENLKLR